MRLRRIVFTTLLLGAIGLGIVLMTLAAGNSTAGAAASDTHGVYIVKPGNLAVTVTESGNLKAKDSETVKSPLENQQATILSLVDEGSTVKKGDELVRFDDKDVVKRIEELEEQRIEREAAIKSATADMEIKASSHAIELQKAELEAEVAAKELEKAIEGTMKLERRKLELKLSDAIFQEEKIGKDLVEMEDLHEREGTFSGDQVEEKRVARDKAIKEHESAVIELDIFTRYTEPMEIKKRKNDIASAESALANVRKKQEAELASAEAVLRRAQRQLTQNTDQLEKEQIALKKMVVTSPGDGIVVFGDPDQPWREKAKVGDSVYPRQTILTLPFLSQMQVQFDIHEADIAKIKVGQKARVTLEMDPGLELSGEVTKIGALAAAGGWREDSSVRKFQCEVTLDQKDTGHKPGLSAKVEILIDQLSDVLTVPIQAVHVVDGKRLVYVDEGGAPRPREVTLGAAGKTSVQVTEGLEAGARVLLADPEIKGK